MSYQILFSDDANYDMVKLEQYIRERLKAPITASKYMEDLDNIIQKLAVYADIISINEFVQEKFGNNARHINFKKMAIIYIVENDIVYIERIIASSLIY